MHRINDKWQPTVTGTGIFGFFGDYRFLSNFHEVLLTVDGLTYPSSEHAYMAQKSLDNDVRHTIAALPTPGAARRAGQLVVLRPDWTEARVPAMLKVLLAKFENPELAQRLLATGEAYLEETNYWSDCHWGVCNGVGENFLGRCLMAVRDHLRNRALRIGPVWPDERRPVALRRQAVE